MEATKGLWAMVGHLVSVLSVMGRRWRAWRGERGMFQSCMESGLQVRTGPLGAWPQGSNVKGILPEAGAQTPLAVCAVRPLQIPWSVVPGLEVRATGPASCPRTPLTL